MSKIPEISSDPSLGFSERHWAAEPDIPALVAAGKLRATNPNRAAQEFRALAERGSAFGLLNLGFMYQKGIGVRKNLARAEHYYTLADKAGSIYGTYSLGLLYFRQRKMLQARELFEKCDNQGFAPALHKLGRMYFNGWGVKRDIPKALYLWRQGVSLGNILSNVSLGLAYLRLKGGTDKFFTGFQLIGSSFRRYNQIRQTNPGSDLLK